MYMYDSVFLSWLECGGILDSHLDCQVVHCLSGFHHSLGTCLRKLCVYCVFEKWKPNNSLSDSPIC